MIEAKWRYKGETTWNYKDYNNEEAMLLDLDKDPKEVEEYHSRPKPEVKNPFKNWWNNIRNTKKNWGKVRGSPFASLNFAMKIRKILVGILIPYIGWSIFNMVRKYQIDGVMGTLNRLFMIGIGIYICWKIYQTIPQAKKQIEYYKKYPHTINYVPTNTKETVDDIFKKIEENSKSKKQKEDNNKK